MEDKIPKALIPAIDDLEPKTMIESNPTNRFVMTSFFTKRSLEKDEEEKNMEARILDQSEASDQ